MAVVGRLGERQGELFADRWPTDPHQLAVLVNRLSSRLGSERVLRRAAQEPCAGANGSEVARGDGPTSDSEGNCEDAKCKRLQIEEMEAISNS